MWSHCPTTRTPGGQVRALARGWPRGSCTVGELSASLGLRCSCSSLELMVSMGYTREEIQDSLVGQKYNEVMATYLLLGYKSSEVSGPHGLTHEVPLTGQVRPLASALGALLPSAQGCCSHALPLAHTHAHSPSHSLLVPGPFQACHGVVSSPH